MAEFIGEGDAGDRCGLDELERMELDWIASLDELTIAIESLDELLDELRNQSAR
jgi:hypothetical protein